MGITRVLKRHNRLFLVFLCGGATLSFYLSDHYTRRWSKNIVLEEGLNTCFSRLNNSYTAHLLGDTTSLALSPSFLGETEQCFSDVIAYSEKAQASWSREVVAPVNAISTETFRLHQKLGDAEPGTSEVMGPFRGVQERVDGVSALLSQQQSSSKAASFYAMATTYGLLFLALWQALFGFFLSGKGKKAQGTGAPPSLEGAPAFSDILAPCLERASGAIFKRGAHIHIEAREDLTVARSLLRGKSLEDALFFALQASLDLGAQEVTIRAKKKKDTLGLEVVSSGLHLPENRKDWGNLNKIDGVLGGDAGVNFRNLRRRKAFAVSFTLEPGRRPPEVQGPGPPAPGLGDTRPPPSTTVNRPA